MENREAGKILNENEMTQAAGGFKYTGILEWLKGHNIACPGCGNEAEDLIEKRYATGLHAYYTCKNCGQKFYYTLSASKKVRVYKE